MKTATTSLLQDLTQQTQTNLQRAEQLLLLVPQQLLQKPHENAWNALECLEHLNYYGDFYIPEIAQQMNNSSLPKNTQFKSSWLGNYFANTMLPKEKLNKMKTLKSTNPVFQSSALDNAVISKFIAQQKELLQLLEKAQQKDLTRIKTAISISKMIKLRLGDTLRVVIYHNTRHMLQAFRAAGLEVSIS